MVTWMLLLVWIISTVINGQSHFYTCPYEEGQFYATSPECLTYYRCLKHMFWIGVCFPWQRFDVHTMTCKRSTEVDCNPEFAGIWRPVYGTDPEDEDKDYNYQKKSEIIEFDEKGQEEEKTKPDLHKLGDEKEAADEDEEATGIDALSKNESIEEEAQEFEKNNQNNRESFSDDKEFIESLEKKNTGFEEVHEKKKRATPDYYWYWCGSGRYVVVQSDQDAEAICLQLQDPEFIGEEGGTQQGGDWAGHTFLGQENSH